jgi:hypothetical protein
MLEVHGEMENTGRAVLNPKITWGHAPQTAGNGIGAGERPTLMTIHHAK